MIEWMAGINLLMATWLIGELVPWQVMFWICLAIYLVLKGLVLLHYQRRRKRFFGLREWLVWLFTWPGMNADAFFRVDPTVESPTASQWFWGWGKVVFGFVLIFGIAPRAVLVHDLLGGWVAMCGFVFVLHFGILYLSALAWRRVHRPVEPIMNAPVLSTSLDEFWGRRWNLAFRDFASVFIFRPLFRRCGPIAALWGSFTFSGIVHDLAISVSARAGFGLPTAYFLLQGAGVLVERSRVGQRMGLGSGWRGWLFAVLVTTPAAFFLFHPPFVREVIIPLIPPRWP